MPKTEEKKEIINASSQKIAYTLHTTHTVIDQHLHFRMVTSKDGNIISFFKLE